MQVFLVKSCPSKLLFASSFYWKQTSHQSLRRFWPPTSWKFLNQNLDSYQMLLFYWIWISFRLARQNEILCTTSSTCLPCSFLWLTAICFLLKCYTDVAYHSRCLRSQGIQHLSGNSFATCVFIMIPFLLHLTWSPYRIRLISYYFTFNACLERILILWMSFWSHLLGNIPHCDRQH